VSTPKIDLPPDIQGHFAAMETDEEELPFTWGAIRNTVYGMGAAIADAGRLLATEGRDAALGRLNDAVHLLFAFAEGEFEDICERHGLDSTTESYNAFFDKRIETAMGDDE
jgi:hypothetical protein